MIHYTLRCHEGHTFDGWFKDSATFERMAARGLVECPSCGSRRVERALMTPAIGSGAKGRGSTEADPGRGQPAQAAAAKAAAGPMPAEIVAMLQRLRAEIERNCDYVGPRFAEEARRIHEGEAEPRGIYGEATPEEAEALREDGIRFETIPWVKPADG
ncbi:DUF1178 family protein [Elioraea tepida]|jgi:hypothetical protein|uniref:DUF1178 family protein n=1 Tax=Elioraea tepida TaxID=2843330 RepID=A0A975U4Q7_9PROT|nr:DUF1178 family protein [Elioraea tepida]QXM25519.1 DUF1178 family protein [Elioraea tepida]